MFDPFNASAFAMSEWSSFTKAAAWGTGRQQKSSRFFEQRRKV
jgi:hypothetical protein